MGKPGVTRAGYAPRSREDAAVRSSRHGTCLEYRTPKNPQNRAEVRVHPNWHVDLGVEIIPECIRAVCGYEEIIPECIRAVCGYEEVIPECIRASCGYQIRSRV